MSARSLRRFVERVLAERGEDVEFIVLFGSRARGEWTEWSDYDVFIGLRVDDGKRLTDRIYEFSLFSEGEVEPFPYSRSEWERMFDDFHPLLLEVLEYGVVLFDRGAFKRMREKFQEWRKKNIVTPTELGWKITPDSER